ncbi:hypothetical protein E2R51_11540 [Jeotgalibacillus sp. S-D1]|uniref:YIP1 family protein n=1 Tax=Jeotgalibacillus sp. S-D1 TaxID=2552189 RepID=UPI00105A71C9|nr:YIP1 family protein [Jeotgalibacillus sp. S-D1]TDL31846.1 hypothetical protein E2R51_11540 [Jeotgalibacillus sp. S-D1]
MESNPFLSVWTKPKQTIKQVIETKTALFTVLVAALGGLGSGLINVQDSGFNEGLSTIVVFVLALVLGAISGIVGVFIISGLYVLIGKMLGGTGNYQDMIRAMGPAYIPQIGVAIIYLLLAVLYGEVFITEPDPSTFAVTSLPIGVYIASLLVTVGLGIWGTVITCKAIGIVHHFSSLRGFGVILLVAALFFVILIIIGIIVVFAII